MTKQQQISWARKAVHAMLVHQGYIDIPSNEMVGSLFMWHAYKYLEYLLEEAVVEIVDNRYVLTYPEDPPNIYAYIMLP
jgi:hypothetical protein